MHYWLMKSDAGDYTIDDLERDRVEPWTGVRNWEARNFMREMKKGDGVIFYHSDGEPSGAAGIGVVAKEAYPDKTQFDKSSKYFDKRATAKKPLWFLVDVAFVSKFKRTVPITEMRKTKKLMNMLTLRPGSRLSVTPLTREEFETIAALARQNFMKKEK
ncbi:MAG: EVE domain-containing protein [bacterium]|nr:EVE domain-containing protein [bacterium]